MYVDSRYGHVDRKRWIRRAAEWCRYSKVAKTVEPKKKRLEEMNQQLAEATGVIRRCVGVAGWFTSDSGRQTERLEGDSG